jgi:hypothetical protein
MLQVLLHRMTGAAPGLLRRRQELFPPKHEALPNLLFLAQGPAAQAAAASRGLSSHRRVQESKV